MKKENTKELLWTTVLLVATAIVIVLLVVDIIALEDLSMKISNIVSIVICLFALYYGICGYKVPHGNMIRYLLLAFAAAEASEFLFYPEMIKPIAACVLLVTILSSYMAGRLNKNKECKIIVALVGLLLIAIWMMRRFIPLEIPMVQPGLEGMNPTQIPFKTIWIKNIFPKDISRFLSWLILSVSYITRYNEHKKAGIESDK